jgi:hypothetical protein
MCDVANAGEIDLEAGKPNATREKQSMKRKAMERDRSLIVNSAKEVLLA